MHKAPIVLSMAIIFAMSGFSIANAATQTQQPPQRPPFGEFHGAPPVNEGIEGPAPLEHMGPPPQNMDKHMQAKAEMEAKKAEFEKRLNLTEKQKQKIKAQKEADIKKIKPIIDEMHKKRQEFKSVAEDKTLSKEEKTAKLNAIKGDMKQLSTQADTLRKENMKNFEKILNDKQKKEFEKIKEEQKIKMEQRKNSFGHPPFPQNK